MVVAAGSESVGGQRLKVLLADDDPLVRRVVRDTLQADGIAVVGEATTCREAVELALHYRPHVVLTDLVLPEGTAVDLLMRLRAAAAAEVSVVVLTSVDDENAAIDALRAGACGWLSKSMAVQDLPRALRAAREGEAIVTRRFARVLVERVRDTPEAGIGTRPVRSELTGREWEVLDLLCGGLDNQDIADRLGLSPETVRSHVRSILRKLGVATRDAAVAAAPRLRTTG